MKKLLLFILFIMFSMFMPHLAYADVGSNFLVKDTFIPVNPTKAISSSVLEEGDFVYFIVPSDLWLQEYKIIPKNSIIKAKITMLKMPITGINAAMRIETIEMVSPDGRKNSIKGTVTYKGERQIGGDLTPPASYNKALHPRKGEYFNGVVAQYVPSGEYEFGQHITLMPNETLYIILDEDFIPY